MLLQLLHDLLVENGLLLLLYFRWLRLLRRPPALVALVDHRKDDACHLAALVRADHVQVRERLLVKERLVDLNSLVRV